MESSTAVLSVDRQCFVGWVKCWCFRKPWHGDVYDFLFTNNSNSLHNCLFRLKDPFVEGALLNSHVVEQRISTHNFLYRLVQANGANSTNPHSCSCRTCPTMYFLNQQVSSRCCSKLALAQYLGHPFLTQREREKEIRTVCLFLVYVWPIFDVNMLDSIWTFCHTILWTYLCLMLFNDCITLWENIKAVNFSPTSFQRDIASLRTRRKFQRHLPEWSPGNAAQRQESQSHTTLDTDVLGDDWWMRLARGVGYSAMWVCSLMGGWRCLKRNFCPI